MEKFKYVFIAFIFILNLFCSGFVYAAGKTDSEVFPSLSGAEVSLAEISSAPKAVIMLWASWCFACKKELARLKQEPIDLSGVKVYYVNLGENKKTAEKIVSKMQLPAAISESIIIDADSYFAQKYGIIGIPTYLFLKNGQEVARSYSFEKGQATQIFKN